MTLDLRKVMGLQIRRARQDANLTQEDLAERFNKTQKAISAYESGTIAVKVTELPTLASILHKPITYFFGANYANEQVQAIFEQLAPMYRELWLEQGSAYLKMQKKQLEEGLNLYDPITGSLSEEELEDIESLDVDGSPGNADVK